MPRVHAGRPATARRPPARARRQGRRCALAYARPVPLGGQSVHALMGETSSSSRPHPSGAAHEPESLDDGNTIEGREEAAWQHGVAAPQAVPRTAGPRRRRSGRLAPVEPGEHRLAHPEAIAVEQEPLATDVPAPVAAAGPGDIDGFGSEGIGWIGVGLADKVHLLRVAKPQHEAGTTLVAGSPPHLRLPAAAPMAMLRTSSYVVSSRRLGPSDSARPAEPSRGDAKVLPTGSSARVHRRGDGPVRRTSRRACHLSR